MPLGRQQKKKLKQLPKPLAAWLDAAKRFPSLDGVHLQMARELGLTPTQLETLSRHPEQTADLPLERHLERRYSKEFGRERPTSNLPLPNQLLRDWMANTAKGRARRKKMERCRNAQKTKS